MSDADSTKPRREKRTGFSTRVDETGKRYGQLTVLEFSDRTHDRVARWKCLCDCGTITIVRGPELRNGKTTSCGCRRVAICLARGTHGHARRRRSTREYQTWGRMIGRCENQNSPDYEQYGGRGIVVCPRWRDSFEAFYDDMGPRPDGGSIERLDANGNYEPTNCVWASATQQARNKRNNRYVTINGETKLARDWCTIFGISEVAFRYRVRRGMSDVEALTKPKTR